MLLSSVRMFRQMVREIAGEAMMLLLCVAPILAGAFFKFGMPIANSMIMKKMGYVDCLVPYYEFCSWLLAMLTGMLFAFVGGLVVLGEIDDRITAYMCVTPAGVKGYMLSRIVYPGIVSGLVAMIVIPVFSLVHLDVVTLLVMVLSSVFSGMITSMQVVSISTNKVEGMAVGKLAGGFGMTFFIPFVITGKIQYVFAMFPMFWVGKYEMHKNVWQILIAVVLFGVWWYGLYRKYLKKLVEKG
ncbi:MAG: hypothetical protein Q4D54_00600 [Eubacteriales bacterium]|nr:hypothetical protein [Lachnospiraceae bacterium]MDO5126230.1 hypothetical protein [Eubacteriales bacterium]